jgi:hypothetical protein
LFPTFCLFPSIATWKLRYIFSEFCAIYLYTLQIDCSSPESKLRKCTTRSLAFFGINFQTQNSALTSWELSFCSWFKLPTPRG